MSVSIDMLKRVPYMDAVRFQTAAHRTAGSVATDSRAMEKDAIFFALRGDRFNGHDFISAALGKGARALVVEADWAKVNGRMLTTISVPTLIVENSIAALGAFAREHRRAWGGRVVAVGGSNGKTTTKDMINVVLSAKFNVVATEANFNNHIGVPLTLLRLGARHEVAVVEMGTNHPGEMAVLCAIAEPTHGILTNIGDEHLEHFGSVDGVAAEEGTLFAWLAAHKGSAFVNADDTLVVAKSRKVPRRVTYGFNTPRVSVRGTALVVDRDARPGFAIARAGKRQIDISLKTAGLHSARNTLAAATVGLTFGVSAAGVVRALTSFNATSKRMQALSLNGVSILNDTYNANPDSMRAALETLRAIETGGKRIAVLADMLELGPAAEREHTELGRSLKRYDVDYLLGFGPLTRLSVASSTAKTSLHFDQKNVLAEYLHELVSEGDVILVKGSRGMKMEDVVTFLTESSNRAA